MHRLFTLIIFISSFSFASVLELSTGQRKQIPTQGAKKIAVRHPEIADIETGREDQSVTVTGVSEGRTTLDLFKKNGEKVTVDIIVISANQFDKKSVEAALEGVEGLETYNNGNTTIIDGDIYRVEDFQVVKKLLRRHKHVENRSRFHPKVLEYLARQIQDDLSKHRFTGTLVQIQANGLLIKGEARSKKDVDQISRIVKAIFPDAIFDITNQLPKESSTLVDIKFLEVRKSNVADIGVKWPASFYADGGLSLYGSGKSPSMIIGAQSPLTLNTLVEKGIVRVLSNPKILCKSGKPASFLAGGEIPIRLISERSASVSFKQYGINLEITARMDRSQNIALEVFAKISDIDSSVMIEGLPGFIEHHIQTAVDLKTDETVVLAGLLESKNRKNVSKFPLLGHVPILGELFKSRSFQNNESEFLVTLTPTDPDHSKARQQHQLLHHTSSKPLNFSLLD